MSLESFLDEVLKAKRRALREASTARVAERAAEQAQELQFFSSTFEADDGARLELLRRELGSIIAAFGGFASIERSEAPLEVRIDNVTQEEAVHLFIAHFNKHGVSTVSRSLLCSLHVHI